MELVQDVSGGQLEDSGMFRQEETKKPGALGRESHSFSAAKRARPPHTTTTTTTTDLTNINFIFLANYPDAAQVNTMTSGW